MTSPDAVQVAAPYWPLVTLLIGACLGVLGHSAWTAWEDQRSGK